MSNVTRPGPGLVQIQRSGRRWDLTFEGYTETGAVGGYLWPGGVPTGIQITPLVVLEDPVQRGEFELTGLTTEAIQSMDPSIANWFAQEAVGMDDSTDPLEPSSSSTGPDTAEPPPLDIKMDKNEFIEWIHRQLEETER